MANSTQIAAIMGPTLVVVTASEALNLDIWTGIAAPVVYLNGALLFVAGLVVVRAHNVWTMRWPVVVTLVGWLALIAGSYRLFAPHAPQAGDGPAAYAGITGLCFVGLLLSFKAYVKFSRD